MAVNMSLVSNQTRCDMPRWAVATQLGVIQNRAHIWWYRTLWAVMGRLVMEERADLQSMENL